ncbi:MAG: universal stress protein, partial [Deltaproteobacteria bacterium]|nr:universal stress protein [Deltaproteobacteria bacterium]
MFQRIILAHDLTPTWDDIVACAGEFRALGCTEIILTHVVTVLYLGGMEGALREEGREHLEAQKAQLESMGFTVAVQIPTGLPAQSLNEVARCHGADLIVMGSHGKSPWREAVLGCVTCAVLHNIEYPTLLLPVQVREDRPDGYCLLQGAHLFRHVLYLTDFSDISERAGEYLVGLAPQGMSRVSVVHALDLPPSEHYPPGYQEKA